MQVNLTSSLKILVKCRNFTSFVTSLNSLIWKKLATLNSSPSFLSSHYYTCSSCVKKNYWFFSPKRAPEKSSWKNDFPKVNGTLFILKLSLNKKNRNRYHWIAYFIHKSSIHMKLKTIEVWVREKRKKKKRPQ